MQPLKGTDIPGMGAKTLAVPLRVDTNCIELANERRLPTEIMQRTGAAVELLGLGVIQALSPPQCHLEPVGAISGTNRNVENRLEREGTSWRSMGQTCQVKFSELPDHEWRTLKVGSSGHPLHRFCPS